MRTYVGIMTLFGGVMIVAVAGDCLVVDNSASATSCDPGDTDYVCFPCTGGVCGLADNPDAAPDMVTAQVLEYKGKRKAIKEADS